MSNVLVDGVEYIVPADVDGLRGVPVGLPPRPVRVTRPGEQRRQGRSGRVRVSRVQVGLRVGFGSLAEMREVASAFDA
jgi:hypothetical protein